MIDLMTTQLKEDGSGYLTVVYDIEGFGVTSDSNERRVHITFAENDEENVTITLCVHAAASLLHHLAGALETTLENTTNCETIDKLPDKNHDIPPQGSRGNSRPLSLKPPRGSRRKPLPRKRRA